MKAQNILGAWFISSVGFFFRRLFIVLCASSPFYRHTNWQSHCSNFSLRSCVHIIHRRMARFQTHYRHRAAGEFVFSSSERLPFRHCAKRQRRKKRRLFVIGNGAMWSPDRIWHCAIIRYLCSYLPHIFSMAASGNQMIPASSYSLQTIQSRNLKP